MCFFRGVNPILCNTCDLVMVGLKKTALTFLSLTIIKEHRMSLFKNIFSKDKKETLDKGLEKSKTSFFSKLGKAVAGKSKVDDEVLDSLEEILVTSDVGVNTTLKIIDRIEKRVARDKYMGTDELNTIRGNLKDEMMISPNVVGDRVATGKHDWTILAPVMASDDVIHTFNALQRLS